MSAPFLFEPSGSGEAEPLGADPVDPPAPPLGRQTNETQTRSLYRRYRPQTFDPDDLVGQEPVVRTLRNAIRLDRVAHAYLFCGPRGTGKTTTARLLAKAVNCLDPDPDRRPCNHCPSCLAIASGATTDVVEIDAASNRGIDDIRDLRERVKYAPTQLRTKFYIVDEAHQITGPAANAFLKTLEEPPGHTKFVLATTDPEELLPTIVSRCQRFDFRRIGVDAMTARLRTVAAAEQLPVTDEALAVVARHATGSLRDALGLLDQLALFRADAEGAASAITGDDVRAMLGVSRNERIEAVVAAIADRDPTAALGLVNAAVDAGEDARQLNRQLVAYVRLLLHQRAGGTDAADAAAVALAARFDVGELADLARRFSEIDFKIKHSPYGQLPLEVALVEAILHQSESTSPRPGPVQRPAAPTPNGHNAVPVPEAPAPAPVGTEPGPGGVVRPATTSLRDRVRGVEERRAPLPPPQTSVPVTPPQPSTANGTANSDGVVSASGSESPLDVEQIVDLWSRIRQDVKAVNRRIEALLSSVDPAAVNGDRITLTAAYEFHRDKLNSDEVRGVVEGVIGRLLARPVRVECLLRGDAARLAIPKLESSSAPTPSVATLPAAEPKIGAGAETVAAVTDDAADHDADEQRLRAAKNIFDAEEIEPGSGFAG